MDLSLARFFYPPQSAGLPVPLGLLDYAAARIAWLLLQLAAICAIVCSACAGLRRREDGVRAPWGAAVLAAIIIGNPAFMMADHRVHNDRSGRSHLLANQAVLDLDDLDHHIHAAVAEAKRRRAAPLLESFRRAA